MSARPTQLPRPGSADTIYLIDLSGYVFRAYHAIAPLRNAHGEPTHATYGTLQMVQKLINEKKPALLGVALEGGRGFRDELAATYKANRPPPPEDLAIQLKRCFEIVDAYRIPALRAEGFEADDVIATIVTKAVAAGYQVVIASADKDLMQLVSDRCVMWDAMRDRVYGPPEVAHKFGVGPERLRDLLALVGDTSDNVPGVPKVGLKTAADLLNEFGSFDGIYARLSEVKKAAIAKSLAEHEADAKLSRELVTLRLDAPVPFDPKALAYEGGDVERLRGLFTELGFTRQLAELPRATKVKAVDISVENRTILEPSALEAIAARAASEKRLAIYGHTTPEDAMRCALVGLSLGVDKGECAYVPIGHRTLSAPKQLPIAEVLRILGPVLVDPNVEKLGHDVKRLDVVLRRNGVFLKGVTFDAMLASYLLDPEVDHAMVTVAEREGGIKLGKFEAVAPKVKNRPVSSMEPMEVDDASKWAGPFADALLRVAEHQRERMREAGVDRLLAELELPLAAVLADLEMRGALVDTRVLEGLGEIMAKELAALEEEAKKASGHPDLNVGSPRQLETVLFDELGLKATKKTKTGRSTDAEALEAIADDHALPKIILEHRAIAKLKSTYVDALPKLILPSTGRIHGHWRQAVAATGRISSEEPNLQNIPIRTALGREIRKAFVAPPGSVFMSADYSQIELRVLAHLSHDARMVEAFKTGQDIHVRTAMEVFQVPADEVTDDMRRKSKTINFGVIYGMGDTALGKRLGIPRKEAGRFIDAYFERYEGVAKFMEATLAEAKRTDRVRTLLGRIRILPDLHNSDHMRRSYAERIAQNTPIQGTAADILKLAMVKLREPVVEGARMILTVHDELTFEVPEASVEEASKRIREAMENVVKLDVPLEVDVAWGSSWAAKA